MKKVILFFCLTLYFASLKAQNVNSDKPEVIAKTQYGELTFYRKTCTKNKLEFVQSGNKRIADKSVDSILNNRNLAEEKVKFKFILDNSGKIVSCEILRPSKIERLNVFLLEVFNEAISNLRSENYNLSCGKRRKEFFVAVTYAGRKK